MAILSLIDDAASALRRVRRKSRNFFHLVLILAMGFGCVTGGFNIAYGILNNPFPSSHPEHVVVATSNDTRFLLYNYDLPNPHLSAVFEKTSEFKLLDANPESLENPRRLQVAMVNTDFFRPSESPFPPATTSSRVTTHIQPPPPCLSCQSS